jgi:hypothetical protein
MRAAIFLHLIAPKKHFQVNSNSLQKRTQAVKTFLILILVGLFGGLIAVRLIPPSPKASTVNSPPAKALPKGAWRVNKAGFGCGSQDDFLEIVSIFNRYDEASAIARTKHYFEKDRKPWKLCMVFNVGDVVYIREVDKWLQTVELYKLVPGADGKYKAADGNGYYSSSVLLGLTQ